MITEERIGVIGDIHGNLEALKAALVVLQDRGIDRLVIMGDLLTYGPDVEQIIDVVASLSMKYPLSVLSGNHEDYYLRANDPDIVDKVEKLPEWIRESIEHTRQCHGIELLSQLRFVPYFNYEKLLFAHANPFGQRDWTYLRSEYDYQKAADVLLNQGIVFGTFAHTHRCKAFHVSNLSVSELNWQIPLEHDISEMGVTVINTGSIGQPREQNFSGIYAVLLTRNQRYIRCEYLPLACNFRETIAKLQQTRLSAGTLKKLCSYLSVGK